MPRNKRMLTDEDKRFILNNCRDTKVSVMAEIIGANKDTIYKFLNDKGITPHLDKKEPAYLREPEKRFHNI